MNKKRNLIIDIDDTIINSREAFCSVYNRIYDKHPDWKFADWKLNRQWDLKDVCPLCKSHCNIFASELFFEFANFICDETYEVLEKLSETYNIIPCSLGNPKNISLKSLWIEENLPFVKQSILLYNRHGNVDKSIVNMSGCIFIDDLTVNLETSNAGFKICFDTKLPWNQDWAGIRVTSYNEIYDILTD